MNCPLCPDGKLGHAFPDDRFQHQGLLVRLWRRRHYWRAPLTFVSILWYEFRHREGLSVRSAWDLALGDAQSPMRWYYTRKEVGL